MLTKGDASGAFTFGWGVGTGGVTIVATTGTVLAGTTVAVGAIGATVAGGAAVVAALGLGLNAAESALNPPIVTGAVVLTIAWFGTVKSLVLKSFALF